MIIEKFWKYEVINKWRKTNGDNDLVKEKRVVFIAFRDNNICQRYLWFILSLSWIRIRQSDRELYVVPEPQTERKFWNFRVAENRKPLDRSFLQQHVASFIAKVLDNDFQIKERK